MRRLYFFFIALGFTILLNAQGVVNNLVVFSNAGEAFTLIMNGERYNMTPQTRLRVTGLTLEKYQVKIVFEDPKLKDHNTTLTFFSTGWECEFALNKRGKKKHSMDFFTQKRIEGFDQVNGGNENVNSGHSTSDNSNTANNNTNGNDNNSNGNNGTNTSGNNNNTAQESTPTNTMLTGTGAIPQYNIPSNNNNCNTPLTPGQFEKYKKDIMQKTTDEDKKVIALLLIENHCLITSQVRQLVDMFVADNVKLDIAKKAYEITKDYPNYSTLTEAFMTTIVKDEFKKFMSSKPHH